MSKYPYLLDELVNRGWTQEKLEKLAGKNLLRVFRAVEQVSVAISLYCICKIIQQMFLFLFYNWVNKIFILCVGQRHTSQ